MSQTIVPDRLKKLRNRKGLSLDALDEKANVDRQTIHRIETGHRQAVRMSTVKKLADALGVSPEVLTGQAPLPEAAKPLNDEDYSINVPVDGAIRNAFTLVQMRYQVPIARITELAPFLFVLAAEASLKRRTLKLEELEKALGQAEALEQSFPHLPSSLSPSSYNFIAAERKSILAADIFGSHVPDKLFEGAFAIEEDYNAEKHNPFAVYLEEAASSLEEVASADAGVAVGTETLFRPSRSPLASIRGFDRSSCRFDVCREDALRLVDGAEDKEELATSIVDGEVILHRMPRDLLGHDALDARIAWLREMRDERRAFFDEAMRHLIEGTEP